MSRARTVMLALGAVLLLCVGVIATDQAGLILDANTAVPPATERSPTPAEGSPNLPELSPTPADDPGYSDLR